MKLLRTIALLLLSIPLFVSAQTEPIDELVSSVSESNAYIFVRDDCSHCQDLKAFIADHPSEFANYTINYIDIYTENGRTLFNHTTDILETGRVTPISLVNNQVYIGYAEETLGAALLAHTQSPTTAPFANYLTKSQYTNTGSTCEEGSLEPCAPVTSTPVTVPVLGTIDPQQISLSFMAIVLGFVDGFNPCAMWVLLTFLLILSQVGDRKKMIQVAGLFIIAEAVMYYFILNIWYQTWDFIALDGIVTPLVGLLAFGSGGFFTYKYWKNRNKPMVCEVTSVEHQQKTEQRIQDFVSRPMTLFVAIGIIGLALSVNIIEFACSIGIPQAFTKVLELNNLSFAQYQSYTLLYTLFYMADDFIVFGLAIWGYQKFYQVGQKYSRYSTLVAGILMLLLGLILLFQPDLLAM